MRVENSQPPERIYKLLIALPVIMRRGSAAWQWRVSGVGGGSAARHASAGLSLASFNATWVGTPLHVVSKASQPRLLTGYLIEGAALRERVVMEPSVSVN